MVLCSQTKKGIATQGKMPISNNVPCKLATFSTGFTAARQQKTVLSHVSFYAIIFKNNKSFICDKNGGVLARIVQGFFSPCLNSWHLLKHKIFPHRFCDVCFPKNYGLAFRFLLISAATICNSKTAPQCSVPSHSFFGKNNSTDIVLICHTILFRQYIVIFHQVFSEKGDWRVGQA